MLEIYWWEHDLKHSKSINNEEVFLTHFWVIVKMSAGKAVSISTQSQEDRYSLPKGTHKSIAASGSSGVAGLLCPRSPPSRPGGALCGWGRRQQVPGVFLSCTTRKSQPVTQCPTGITGVAKLTIWGPTFTLIGPKVFGKILVGELVLETGNVITEILPKKSVKRRSVKLLP